MPGAVSMHEVIQAMCLIASMPDALWGTPHSSNHRSGRAGHPFIPVTGLEVEASEVLWAHPNGWRMSRREFIVSPLYPNPARTMTYRHYWITGPNDDVNTQRQLYYMGRGDDVLRLCLCYQVTNPKLWLGPYDILVLAFKRLDALTIDDLDVGPRQSLLNPLRGQLRNPLPQPSEQDVLEMMSHWLPAELYQTIREEAESATDPAT